ncbi:MAG: MerR family transcriptional regulator [Spirochaetes bacterium]|nr:MerR family transcriptional regulator [Spirochaetota bacterium]
MSIKENITISELSRLCGIPTSTIRFYLREGLISPPQKKGKTRAYYNNGHIKQLKTLKQLRSKDKLSIEEIKRNHSISLNTADSVIGQSQSLDRKDDIITAAIELFRSKGYDDISINDIAEKSSISKATFYKHFSDKEELFYECADRVFYDIDREFNELLNEKDVIKRLSLRGSLFIKTHRHMIDMLQLVRGTSSGLEAKNRLKLNRIIANLAGPIATDLNDGIRQGFFKEMNTHIVAHLLMGVAEYGIYFCDGKSSDEIDQFINRGIRVVLNGIMQNQEINRNE